MSIKTMENEKINEPSTSPIISLNFLKILVIILGIAILSLIFIICYKLLNGGLSDNKFKQNISSEDFILSLPDESSIKSVSLDGENILIYMEEKNQKKLILLIDAKKIKVITIKNGKNIKIDKQK